MIGQTGRSRIAESATWILNGAELCLFANDAKMADDPFGYEEAKGYVPRQFSQVGWRWNTDTDPMVGVYEPVSLRVMQDQTIYGYFIRGMDGSVVNAEKLAKPFEARAGDSVLIYPRISIKVKK